MKANIAMVNLVMQQRVEVAQTLPGLYCRTQLEE